ncbi:hypothetical protein [Streptomyces sp. NPDC059092]|uniref:hypothetical protein n=1 Tax=Streptomyces sp. NPDC059092 TaxID=3346725 RepID=UPI00369A186F
MTQPNVVVVTGASRGLGSLTARALAEARHIAYAGTRATADRGALEPLPPPTGA